MTRYRLIEVLSDDIVVLRRSGSDSGHLPEMMWSVCTTRKPFHCRVCQQEFMPGTSAFRPVNNSVLYRYERICAPCVRGTAADVEKETRDMDRKQASVLCRLIETLEERTNHQAIRDAMEKEGYAFDEVDSALRALSKIAGYDISWS